MIRTTCAVQFNYRLDYQTLTYVTLSEELLVAHADQNSNADSSEC